MANNLHVYHKVLGQLCQWLPRERITRLRNMALFLVGLQQSRGIHLSQIVNRWPGVAGKGPSLVNRLRRFLSNPAVEVQRWYEPLARHLVARFRGQPICLIIDCTKVGFNFRMLSISLAYKKRALPLAWSIQRGRKGHVSHQQQLALLSHVASLLDDEAEVWLLGDAGFESVHLLTWLRKQRWHFVLRQPGKNQVRWPGQGWVKLIDLPLHPGQTRVIGWVELTEKHAAGPFWLLLHWTPGEDQPWFLIADAPHQQGQLIRLYGRRMWTEELFGDLKGHGFDLEATHLDDPDRIARLVLALAINFVWFITLGSWVVKRGFRPFVDTKSRRDKSYFRIGWDWIDRCLRLNDPVPLHFSPYF